MQHLRASVTYKGTHVSSTEGIKALLKRKVRNKGRVGQFKGGLVQFKGAYVALARWTEFVRS